MGQFFSFFLTPMPVVSLDACWKAPPFILICAYPTFQGKPLGLTLLANYCWPELELNTSSTVASAS